MKDPAVHALRHNGPSSCAYPLDLGGGHTVAGDVPRNLREVDDPTDGRGLRLAFAADTSLYGDDEHVAFELLVGAPTWPW